MTTPSRRSSGPVLAFGPSISPRAGGGASFAFAFAFASSSSSITGSSRNSFSQQRSAQPPAPPVRCSLDRSTSYGHSLKRSPAAPARRTCLCSPSTHPGSFRCSLHKGLDLHNPSHVVAAAAAAASPSNRLNARRSAMANSLVRIGAVEGEWVKRALAALIRPSSQQQRRRTNFQPRPTRLSRMSKAVQPIDLESVQSRSNVFVCSVLGVLSVSVAVSFNDVCFCQSAAWNLNWELLLGGKTLLKLTIPRIRLLRNRREIQLKQMRKDIAKLLEDGQEATARIRVEHIIREENMMAAQEILELFCELIAVRLPIIESQRECPLDLKEAISTICFAAPRCADLPELQQVQMLFAAKYGKEFATAATYLLPDCGVNRQVIELLSIRVPSVETKLKLLKEIAEQHELDWDPSTTENEFRKPHEDLLNGPNHVTNGSSLPLPPQKHDEHDDALSSDRTDESHIEPGSDADLDSLDLPRVPKDSVRATIDVPSALGNVSSRPPSAAHDLGFGHPEVTKSISSEDMPQVPPVEPAVSDIEPSSTSSPNQSNAVIAANKQFIPFVIPPPLSSFSAPPKQNEFSDPSWLSSTSQPAPSPPPPSSISPSPNGGECVLPPPPLSSFSDYQAQNEPASSHPSFSSRAKCEIDVDLQDVLTAAQSAAETAEHAAIAARAAANLAQVRLTDLLEKSESHGEGFEEHTDLANPIFHHHQQQYSFGNKEKSTDYGQGQIWDSPTHRSHEPQSSPVSEDEPYLAYPNLFASKDSDLKSDIHNSY